ncbi:putative HD superfamily hydrolase [Rivularia sp. PCC 7116]|uniref:HD domain-containing protein n=1 Tax=Rivularia sp. PCC 7116 TaxID=373994 RepID=UPI00029F4DF5|nr:HD domain-containing protein [Rivularia sp. PCC 7116]AFY58116.1 putative HD superfamily hydrolase [Rivularia sp. PCC 7116]
METKGDLPLSFLKDKNTLPIIEAYFEFVQLKQLYRQGWLNQGISPQNCESVAEHSFCVALLALFLADQYSIKVDSARVIKMALIHDLGEVYAGDFTPTDNIDKNQKYQLEKQSVVKVLGKLRNGHEWIALWEEYEQGESAESQFVRQLDKLEMALQASVYEHQNNLNLSVFFASANRSLSSVELKFIFSNLELLRVS